PLAGRVGMTIRPTQSAGITLPGVALCSAQCSAQTVVTAMSTLKFGDFGPYGELVQRPLPEGLVLVFVPILADLSLQAQDLNGGALTEAQVLRIRDGSKVMVVGPDQVRAVEEARGYVDIDAADAWQSWLRLPEAQR